MPGLDDAVGGIFEGLGGLLGMGAGRAAQVRAGHDIEANRGLYDNLLDNSRINAEQAAATGVPEGDVGQGNAYTQQALQSLAGVANAGGMDPQSQAALQQAQMSNNMQAGGANQAALQQAQAQGRLNSGRSLMAQVANNQGAANSNAMAGTQAAGDARTRALQAMSQQGSLGLNLGANQYGQAAQHGTAQDMINQFNASNRQNAQQQSFNNQATATAGRAGVNTDLANFNLKQYNNLQKTAQNAGAGVDASAQTAARIVGGIL